MGTEILLSGISVILLVSAALLALSLVRLTRRRAAWFLIAAALLLMAATSGISALHLARGESSGMPPLPAEMATLIVAALLVVGLAAIRPIFVALRCSESKLRESEAKYRDLFENAIDPIFIVDADFRYLDVNKKAVELFGFSKEEFLRMSILDVVPPEQVPKSRAELEKLKTRGAYEKFTGKMLKKDGSYLDIEVSSSAIVRDGRIVGSRDIVRDISERKKAEGELLRLTERLRQQASHDNLTGLPNRRLFFDRLEQAIARSRRFGEGLAVLFIDLDDFKLINDRLGHQAGDNALRTIGRRLKESLRQVDSVGRLGGDEFAVVVQGINGREDISTVIEKIYDRFKEPIQVQGTSCPVSLSIGISLCPGDGITPEALIVQADNAMYGAKKKAKGSYGFCDTNQSFPDGEISAKKGAGEFSPE